MISITKYTPTSIIDAMICSRVYALGVIPMEHIVEQSGLWW